MLTQKLKILHVNWSGNLGGTENFAFQLAKTQKIAEHDITIAYMGKRSIIGQRAESTGIKTFECRMHSPVDFFNLSKCFRLVKKEKYDIIHNHNGSPFLNIAKFFSPGSILINHFHGTSLGNEKWENSKVLLWKRISSCLVDHFFANSNFTKNMIMKKYGYPKHKVSVVYNGIDLVNFHPNKEKIMIRKEFGLKDSKKVVGIVARLTPQKGIDKFIEVAKIMANEIEDVKFLVVGDGELRSQLETKANELNLEKKVIFTGARTDVPDLLSIFDIFLLTSNWEPFGITLLEAMAIGVPIVAFAVDGVKEVINDHCAILIPPGDTKSMAYQVLTLLRDKRKRRDLSKSGLIHVKKFNIEIASQKTIQIYKSLLT